MLNKLKKIPNYIAVFGFFSGLRLFCQIEWLVGNNSVEHTAFKTPGFEFPIYLRPTIGDHSAYWICLVAGQYSVEPFPQRKRLLAVYNSMVEKGQVPLIIDAGANIGMSALWYAKTYPKAKIFAIEPDRKNYDLLVKNIRGFEERITPFWGGIWHRESDLLIENPDGGAQHFRTREVPKGTDGALSSISVDSILTQTQSNEIFIAKIDIEGGQESLFRENTAWVENTHLIVLELDDWQFPWAGTSRSFISCVGNYKFDYLLHGENIFCFHDLGGHGRIEGASIYEQEQ